jgi:hypothetical protein
MCSYFQYLEAFSIHNLRMCCAMVTMDALNTAQLELNRKYLDLVYRCTSVKYMKEFDFIVDKETDVHFLFSFHKMHLM